MRSLTAVGLLLILICAPKVDAQGDPSAGDNGATGDNGPPEPHCTGSECCTASDNCAGCSVYNEITYPSSGTSSVDPYVRTFASTECRKNGDDVCTVPIPGRDESACNNGNGQGAQCDYMCSANGRFTEYENCLTNLANSFGDSSVAGSPKCGPVPSGYICKVGGAAVEGDCFEDWKSRNPEWVAETERGSCGGTSQEAISAHGAQGCAAYPYIATESDCEIYTGCTWTPKAAGSAGTGMSGMMGMGSRFGMTGMTENQIGGVVTTVDGTQANDGTTTTPDGQGGNQGTGPNDGTTDTPASGAKERGWTWLCDCEAAKKVDQSGGRTPMSRAEWDGCADQCEAARGNWAWLCRFDKLNPYPENMYCAESAAPATGRRLLLVQETVAKNIAARAIHCH